MNYPERFSNLPEYAFPRLRSLLDAHKPGGPVRSLALGEPQHAYPEFVKTALNEAILGFNNYPNNNGTDALLDAIQAWIKRRFSANITHDQLMVLNGTREGIFNAQLALLPERKNNQVPLVVLPNPFYQVYAVGAIAAGAQTRFLNATAQAGYMPDLSEISEDDLNRMVGLFICSPSNPQGAVASFDYYKTALELAEKHDFIVFSDECYSEIYRNDPPVGALEVAQQIGADPERLVVFHSLSKRSNLPGLRSGVVASGPNNIAEIRKLRSYSGAPVPSPIQAASAAVWADDAHVRANRDAYREKYQIADRLLSDVAGYMPPEAGFFLWLPIKDGEAAALKLWKETGIRTLPGGYLARDTAHGNPGADYLRIAMVSQASEFEPTLATLKECLFQS